eukprot:6193141-Amphidinium_carterae.1
MHGLGAARLAAMRHPSAMRRGVEVEGLGWPSFATLPWPRMRKKHLNTPLNDFVRVSDLVRQLEVQSTWTTAKFWFSLDQPG